MDYFYVHIHFYSFTFLVLFHFYYIETIQLLHSTEEGKSYGFRAAWGRKSMTDVSLWVNYTSFWDASVLVVTWSSLLGWNVWEVSLCAFIGNSLRTAAAESSFLRVRAGVSFTVTPGRQKPRRWRWKHRIGGRQPRWSHSTSIFVVIVIVTAQRVIERLVVAMEPSSRSKEPGGFRAVWGL